MSSRGRRPWRSLRYPVRLRRGSSFITKKIFGCPNPEISSKPFHRKANLSQRSLGLRPKKYRITTLISIPIINSISLSKPIQCVIPVLHNEKKPPSQKYYSGITARPTIPPGLFIVSNPFSDFFLSTLNNNRTSVNHKRFAPSVYFF